MPSPLSFLSPALRSFALLVAAILGATHAYADPGVPVPAQKIDFNRDIRPILAENCLKCHGMDAKTREADLRLDVREDAIAGKAIAPGDLKKSELWTRITTTDGDNVMPPPETKKSLTDKQKDLLKRWIEGGAGYAKHWALIPPVRPAIPTISSSLGQAPVRSPLDAFILAKLQAEGVEAAAEASPATWLRRVTFDLTGLPPTLAEMDAFAADATSPRAYERVVDRLLNSATYGETMANDWLDVARYADTYGRHEDADCIVWPYRDWVISAFNSNMPFDQFITWQTAGDMLPNPTQDMLVATCFNRLAQQSNEAGSDPEEFRIEQIADRIRTNGMAFLGLSVECARCHDHKFDPISQRDYYSLASFLNNIDELGLFYVYTGGTPPPAIPLYTPALAIEHDTAVARVAFLEQKQKEALGNAKKRFAEWLKKRKPPQQMPSPSLWDKLIGIFYDSTPRAEPRIPQAKYSFENVHKKEFRNDMDGKQFGIMRNIAPTESGRVGKAVRMAGDNSGALDGVKELKRCDDFTFALWLRPDQSFKRAVVAHRSRAGVDAGYRGVELILEDDRPCFALVHATPAHEIRIRSTKPIPVGQWTHIACAYDGSSRAAGLQIFINGELAATEVVRDQLYRDVTYRPDWGDDNAKDDGKPLAFRIGGRTNDSTFSNGLIDEFIFHDVQLCAPEIRQLALLPETSKPEDWFQWYLRERDDSYRSLSAKLHKARSKENELSAQAIDFMIMKEWTGPKRPTHILARGEFNKPTVEVQPDTLPAVLPFPPELPRNRLGLAQWLTHEKNPLPTRVAVNRLWQHFFGKGIVSTSEDFGTQGQAPTHPELLDYLATTFRNDGWDIKKMCRRIVLSATYRRGSTVAQPLNPQPSTLNPAQLFATGPRYRLNAEQVRDAALAASGLLVANLGGPSVKPYQPAGLWEEAGTQHTYAQEHGANLYRRSFYTFWRRTLPPPSMTVFDAPTREFCKVRRDRTNTPLQTLVLMNDPQFIEAARSLAERLVREHSNDDTARARDAYRLLASDQPSPEQLAVLTRYLAEERQHFTATPAAAEALLSKNGERKADAKLAKIEVAATTLMVRLLLGFNETVMKP